MRFLFTFLVLLGFIPIASADKDDDSLLYLFSKSPVILAGTIKDIPTVILNEDGVPNYIVSLTNVVVFRGEALRIRIHEN